MRAFYLAYPKCDAMRHELSWTHYRLLLRIEKPEARAFYETEAVNSRWSTREMEWQIHSLAGGIIGTGWLLLNGNYRRPLGY
jgi:hypothetical protein